MTDAALLRCACSGWRGTRRPRRGSFARTRRRPWQTVHVSALRNRVPAGMLVIEVVGAAVALGLLALCLAILARGVVSVVLAAAFVSVLLLITFDLDRPVRGLVRVPDTPLVDLRASMELPPAAGGPGER